MTPEPLPARLAARCRAGGPLRFDAFVEAALYDPDGGFYATGGSAGRRGDFLTSPEVGPLFGAVLARALDTWWEALGRPDPFLVVDAGAGPGTLARTVAFADPACRRAGALRYLPVERSAAQRAQHPDPQLVDLGHAGAGPDPTSWPQGVAGVVVANELLDNLPFRLLVNDGGWREAYVDAEPGGRFVEVLAPLPDPGPTFPLPDPRALPHGARLPWQEAAASWLRDALAGIERGRVVVIDYTSVTAALAARPWREWLRTYRAHQRGQHPLHGPGTQDITTEVALDQLVAVREPDAVRTQAQWLALHGMHELVEEGRRIWAEQAARPGLDAMRARSRVREAEALTDPAGLGAFTVAEWAVG